MNSARRSFTLIELLVVVAVIGILASLLLPSLSKAREAARAAACMNNQKQLNTTLAIYTHEHDYYVPLSDGTDHWQHLMLRSMGDDHPRANPKTNPEHTGSKRIFADPSAQNAPGKNWYPWRNDYMYNGFLGAREFWPSSGYLLSSYSRNQFIKPYKADIAPHPNITVTFTDCRGRQPNLPELKYSLNGADTGWSLDYWQNGADYTFPVHNGKSISAFIDGHVEAVTHEFGQKPNKEWLLRPKPYSWWTGSHWGM